MPELTPIAATALATAGDLTTYGYTTGATFLARASARVRGYTKQTITAGISTVVLRYPYLLPERPVVSITSITDPDGATIASTEYRVRGQYIQFDANPDWCTVTYSHGFSVLPDELVEVVCSIAARMAAAPAGLAAGYQSESADGESIAYGSDAFGGVADLTSAEKAVLDRIFPHTRKTPAAVVTM